MRAVAVSNPSRAQATDASLKTIVPDTGSFEFELEMACCVPRSVQDDRPSRLPKIRRVFSPTVGHLLDHSSREFRHTPTVLRSARMSGSGRERGIIDDPFHLLTPSFGRHVAVPDDERAAEVRIATGGRATTSSRSLSRLADNSQDATQPSHDGPRLRRSLPPGRDHFGTATKKAGA